MLLHGRRENQRRLEKCSASRGLNNRRSPRCSDFIRLLLSPTSAASSVSYAWPELDLAPRDGRSCS
jgi:hypothetical protein